MSKGISLIEVIVGAAVISVILISVGAVAQFSLNVSNLSTERLQAVFLTSEGMEALKSMRDASWSGRVAPLASSTQYYLLLESAGGGNYLWNATTTVQSQIDGKFTRIVTVEDVLRDFNDDIAGSGAPDNGARKINVTVSWVSAKGQTFDEKISAYIFNLHGN